MTDRETLAKVLEPRCRGILDRVVGEAHAAGDPGRRRPLAELRDQLDALAARALDALALTGIERRRALMGLVDAGRGGLDRMSVPTIARIGLARLGLRLARVALERELAGREDAASLGREFAAFEADVLAAISEASLVA